jgi:hypothetical protein
MQGLIPTQDPTDPTARWFTHDYSHGSTEPLPGGIVAPMSAIAPIAPVALNSSGTPKPAPLPLWATLLLHVAGGVLFAMVVCAFLVAVDLLFGGSGQ